MMAPAKRVDRGIVPMRFTIGLKYKGKVNLRAKDTR